MKKIMLLALMIAFSPALLAESVIIHTPQGKLQGEHKSVTSFKGIPYALPPTGERRWRAAEPALGWPGIRLATRFGPDCVQEPYPENSFFFRPSFPASEDCLYLNVWTPAEFDQGTTKARLPVMVWIHGGALTRGGAAIDTYDGGHLAEKGVVVVTINYRLGALGYFSHPALTAESPNGASGNQGTSDQIQALKWVRDNIAAFGGNPQRVTIFGESAGSWSVNHLLASPLAKGLFHGAIGQSGAVLTTMPTLKQSNIGPPSAEAAGEALAKKLIPGNDKPSLEDLRSLPAQQIIAKAEASNYNTQAVVDGWIFPDQIYNIMAAGKQNPVPVIVGFNSDEGTTLSGAASLPTDRESYINGVKQRYGQFADQYLKLYPAEDLRRSSLDAFRDGFVSWAMPSWARMTAEVNQPAWLYYFSHRPAGPLQEKLGAYHAAEIPYVFDNYSEALGKEQQLADTMSAYWVAFAKTGNPNTGQPDETALPQWKPHSAADQHYMEFNNETKNGAVPGKDLLPGVWEFWDKVNASLRP